MGWERNSKKDQELFPKLVTIQQNDILKATSIVVFSWKKTKNLPEDEELFPCCPGSGVQLELGRIQ